MIEKGCDNLIRAVFYARTSTEEEKQTRALETQANELREHIKNTPDWELVDEYIDQSSGTTSKGRGEFNRLITEMATSKFDIVVIKDQDRLMRDEYLWYLFRNELLSNNKRLFIKMESRFYMPESDSLITGIKAVIAAQYSRDLSKKMNYAHKTRMKKGTVVTNGRIWGYDQKDGKLVINEKEAEIVRYVFDAYIAGKGFRTIAKELTNMGIRTSNDTPFALTTLKRMIKQEKYKGTLVCGKRHKNFFTKNYDLVPEEDWIVHEYSENVPAIISVELWQQANDILKQKVKHFNLEKPRGYFNGLYPLSGKLICGKCGARLYHTIHRNKRKDGSIHEMRYWMCKNYKTFGKNSPHGCDNTMVRTEILDDIARKVIFEFWEKREECISSVIEALKESLNTNENINLAATIKSEISKLVKKREKLMGLFTDDIIAKDEFKEKSEDILDQISKLQSKLKEIEMIDSGIDSTMDRLSKIHYFLDTELSNPEGISDEIIESIIKEMVVHPNDKVSISLDSSMGTGEIHHSVTSCG